jgi:hypothetical protein
MAGITLAQAEAKLAAYLAAEEAVLNGQSVRHESGRSLTMADLGEIRRGVDTWDAKVKSLSAAASGRGRSRPVAPGW